MKYFYSSFIISIIGIVIAFMLGSFEAVYICILLSILEVSLSFDNAVVNAKVLSSMDKKWQKRFIYWGIPIAVFGMRLIFPILIVAIAANLGIIETLNLALHNPDLYHKSLEGAKSEIYAFGGGFLLMVFLSFLFDNDRDIFWLSFIENNIVMKYAKRIENFHVIISVCIGIALLSYSGNVALGIAYFISIILYLLIASIDSMFSVNGVRSGIMGFLYLELLDASFSFDGVIGAFALSDNIFIIMIGLGVGAMFVRSLTLYFVDRRTLNKIIFLEHGAHYAIGTLAIIMFLKIFMHISEAITGLIGIAFISISYIHSMKYKS